MCKRLEFSILFPKDLSTIIFLLRKVALEETLPLPPKPHLAPSTMSPTLPIQLPFQHGFWLDDPHCLNLPSSCELLVEIRLINKHHPPVIRVDLCQITRDAKEQDINPGVRRRDTKKVVADVTLSRKTGTALHQTAGLSGDAM